MKKTTGEDNSIVDRGRKIIGRMKEELIHLSCRRVDDITNTLTNQWKTIAGGRRREWREVIISPVPFTRHVLYMEWCKATTIMGRRREYE